MRRDLFSSSVSDERTRATLRFWNKYQLLLEPHGAVAWQGFLDWQAPNRSATAPAVILETANPAKFPEEIEKSIGWSPDVRPRMDAAALKLPEDFDRMGADYGKFREYLIQRHTRLDCRRISGILFVPNLTWL
jgi:threonine synthase